uniref:C2H2-type domain-containing protein n=1 Tax=Schizaphis graminum TaxID=13262 RepID=A0A2S2NSD7_SCHGA
MNRSKVKKICTNSDEHFKDLKNCYLCDTINLTHEHSNIISPLLKTINQWEIKTPDQMKNIKFLCFVCIYNSKHFEKWKMHIMSKEHIDRCHILNKVCSYFCKACKTLFYGPEHLIQQHQKNVHGSQNNLSGISILMSELMNCLDSHSMHIYFCAICNIVSAKPIHISEEYHKNQSLYDCKYCNATFLCNKKQLNFHEASVEHLTFKCIYSIEKAIEVNSLKLQKQEKITKTTHDPRTQIKSLELPLIILDRFQITSESMVKCNFCNVNVSWSLQKIVEHISLCLNKGDLTPEIHEMLITAYDCKVCNFYTNLFFNYKLHVISPKHLTSCHASDDFYSYFCTICNLYIYGSKIQINNHLKKKHKTKITDLPFLTKVIKDNYKYISNHPGSDFIDYYSNQQSCEKDFFPVQCNACKISFCMSNYEYKLHEISSEHVILKYFTQKNPTLIMKHNFKYEHLQTTSTTNANCIKYKEALNNKCLSSSKTDNSNLEEISLNKGCTNTKKRKLSVSSTILENNKLFKNCYEGKSHSAILSTNTDPNIQQTIYMIDDDDDNDISLADLNSTKEIIFTDHVQGALHNLNVLMSSDDLTQKNIMYNKLENKTMSQEFLENFKNIDHTKKQKNIQPTKMQSNIKTPYKQLHPTDEDQAYGHYVTERLKNIHNLSVKSNIKTEIDALFCIYNAVSN